MYMPRDSIHMYKRALIDLRMWDVFGVSGKSSRTGRIPNINEVLQIDLCPFGLVDILIHLERNENVVFHKKFYGLTPNAVQQLVYGNV
jgi:hypothetical protein